MVLLDVYWLIIISFTYDTPEFRSRVKVEVAVLGFPS